MLFDVSVNGKTVKGIGQTGKTSWVYLLDRQTGRRLSASTKGWCPKLASRKQRQRRSGNRLWQFQTGAGANAPAVTYQLDGQQYVAVASGGNFQRGTITIDPNAPAPPGGSIQIDG